LIPRPTPFAVGCTEAVLDDRLKKENLLFAVAVRGVAGCGIFGDEFALEAFRSKTCRGGVGV
jgi:hypothetical protein